MTFTYPPVSFFFEVVFQGGGLDKIAVETQFQSVTGLTAELLQTELQEGGENRFKHTLPTGAKYSPLILKRGIVKNSKLLKWCTEAIQYLDIKPVNLLINLLNVESKSADSPDPLMTWKVINAWPKKWAVSDFDAEKSALAIETLELNYQYFEVMK